MYAAQWSCQYIHHMYADTQQKMITIVEACRSNQLILTFLSVKLTIHCNFHPQVESVFETIVEEKEEESTLTSRFCKYTSVTSAVQNLWSALDDCTSGKGFMTCFYSINKMCTHTVVKWSQMYRATTILLHDIKRKNAHILFFWVI